MSRVGGDVTRSSKVSLFNGSAKCDGRVQEPVSKAIKIKIKIKSKSKSKSKSGGE